MINDYFFQNLNNIDLSEMWFQKDGATCHTATETIDLLKTTFNDSIISRNGLVNWPPRSCDITPLDYFLWGYVKSLVYADKSTTIEQLKINIIRVIDEIGPDLCERVACSKEMDQKIWSKECKRGVHLHEVIFHH